MASGILAFLLLYLILRDVDWERFFQILRQAHYAWLPLLIAWDSFDFFVRSVRWRFLVQTEKKVRLVDVFFANMIGFFCNLVLPARAGSLVRAVYLAQLTHVSASYNLATQIVQRIADTVALVVIGALALAFSGTAAPELQTALVVTSVIGVLGFALMLVLPRFSTQLDRLLAWLPLPGSAGKALRPILVGLLHKFLLGLRSLADQRIAAAFGLTTLLVWLIDAVGLVLIAATLNFPLTIFQALVLLAGWGLATVIPLTPGGLGVVQWVTLTVLTLFGISNESALAFILLGQVLNVLVVGFWGILGFARFPLHPPDTV